MEEDNEALPEGFGYVVSEKAAFFYADGGLVGSNNPVLLWWKFGVLIGLFERVRL